MAKDQSRERATKKLAQNARHENLISEILLKYGSTPKLRIFKANTGAIKTENRFFRSNFSGMPDLWGFTNQGMIMFCEVKTGSGRLSKTQASFKKIAEFFNCHYLLCRSIEDFDEFFHKITTA